MLKGNKAVAVVCAAVVLLAACSDDKKSSSTSSGGSTGSQAAAAFSGATSSATFKVMVTGDFTSSIAFTVPETVAAVKAGLKGVPGAEVLSCDSKGDQNAATACEQEAIDKKVSVVVNGFGSVGQDQALLTQAGIPVVGNVDVTAPTAFGLASGLGSYAGLGIAAAEAGCKAAGVLYLDGTDFLVDMIKKGLDAKGSKEAARAAIPANSPDLAPAIAKLTGANADCIILSVTPPMVVQAMTAINQSGATAKVLGVGAIFPKEIVDALGPLADGVITTETQLNPADDAPIVKQIGEDMKSVDSGAQVTTIAIFSWASAEAIASAVKDSTGEVTPAQMLAKLNALKEVAFGGALHPFTATPLASKAFPRFFNHYGLNYKITDGVPQRQGDFFDLSPVLVD